MYKHCFHKDSYKKEMGREMEEAQDQSNCSLFTGQLQAVERQQEALRTPGWDQEAEATNTLPSALAPHVSTLPKQGLSSHRDTEEMGLTSSLYIPEAERGFIQGLS